MKKLALLMCLWPAVAWGQPQILLLDRTLIDNQFTYGVTTLTRGQIVIEQNALEPTIGVCGVGARTRLTPNAAANTAGVFITSENNLCIEPTVEFVNLQGGQNIPDYPIGDPITVVADAIDLLGDAPIVRCNQIFDFAGDAITIAASPSYASRHRRVARVNNNNISHCLNGIVDNGGDSVIADNTVANVAGYGIRVNAGASQLSGNHCFGMETAIYFQNGASRSTNDKASDSFTGFNISPQSSYSSLHGLTSIQCAYRNVWVQGTNVTITGSYIHVNNSADNVGIDYDSDAGTPNQIVGIQVVNERCSITDTIVRMVNANLSYATGTPRSSVGIVLANHNQTLKNVRLEGTSQANEKGVFIEADIEGLDIEVTTGGGSSDFSGVGGAIVYFSDDASPTWSGRVRVVYDSYDGADIPVRIPAGWGAANELTIEIRDSLDDTWTPLVVGQAYP